MNNRTNSPACERSSDLMAFLYNELSSGETPDFASHLRECSRCRQEAASFGSVRESIVAWRDEVLTGFVPSTPTPARKSAVAAFKQFFDLSPLWLKSAAAFALLTICVLIALVFITSKKEPVVAVKTDAIYTQQDVDRLVKEAVAEQQKNALQKTPETTASVIPSPSIPKLAIPKAVIKQTTARNRRPLSRAEREQLAADLRLLPTDDDLDLLGDRINQ